MKLVISCVCLILLATAARAAESVCDGTLESSGTLVARAYATIRVVDGGAPETHLRLDVEQGDARVCGAEVNVIFGGQTYLLPQRSPAVCRYELSLPGEASSYEFSVVKGQDFVRGLCVRTPEDPGHVQFSTSPIAVGQTGRLSWDFSSLSDGANVLVEALDFTPPQTYLKRATGTEHTLPSLAFPRPGAYRVSMVRYLSWKDDSLESNGQRVTSLLISVR